MAILAALTVALGIGAPAAPALAVDSGHIAGQLTSDGAPVADATVLLFDAYEFSSVAYTTTDSTGAFELEAVAGDYKLRFQVGGVLQWSSQKTSFDEADIVSVTAGQTTTIEEELLPYGTITGRFTSGGAAVDGASVDIYDTDFGSIAYADLDEDGRFTVNVLPGEYKLEFRVGEWTQWAYQKTGFYNADVVTVTAGQTTTVEEELLSRGTISGQFTDNGAPVADVFVWVYDTDFRFVASAFTDDDGAFSVDVVPGDYKLRFQAGSFSQWSSQKTSFDDADIVTVIADQTTIVNEEKLAGGTIAGQLTDGGAPVSGASVEVYDTQFGFVTAVVTDAAGAFSVNVTPGQYKLRFQIDGLAQWAVQKFSFFEADPVTVTAGETIIVDEEVLPHGTIAGQVTHADGSPAAFVQVSAAMAGPPYETVRTTTDASGHYTLAALTGEYRVEFRRDFDSPAQWANNARSYSDAELIPVVAGQTTTLDQQLLPLGAITGVLTDTHGAPVANATVIAQDVATGYSEYAFTDGDGQYRVALFGGEYYLAFETSFGTQWATGRASGHLADPITVSPGDEVTHDETLAPLGSIHVTAVDSVEGSADIDALPGRHLLSYLSATGTHLPATTSVEVSSGATTSLVVQLVPAATVTTTIKDRHTGAPVANACLELIPTTGASSLGANTFWCSDESGSVTVTHVQPGQYKAFVWAKDGVHGHQWVGKHGGVGQFLAATTITVTAGAAMTLAPVKLDLAGGDITGTVTDQTTHAPVTQGTVSLSSYSSGFGGQGGVVEIDAQGHYTISGLGPYKWELFFAVPTYAREWSGDAGSRAKAKTVTVKPNSSVTYNTTVGPGTAVSGLITDQSGRVATSARIVVLDAQTGDEVGVYDIGSADQGQYTIPIKGRQKVKVHYHAYVGAQLYTGFVGGPTFASATIYTVPKHGAVTLNITLTQPSP